MRHPPSAQLPKDGSGAGVAEFVSMDRRSCEQWSELWKLASPREAMFLYTIV